MKIVRFHFGTTIPHQFLAVNTHGPTKSRKPCDWHHSRRRWHRTLRSFFLSFFGHMTWDFCINFAREKSSLFRNFFIGFQFSNLEFLLALFFPVVFSVSVLGFSSFPFFQFLWSCSLVSNFFGVSPLFHRFSNCSIGFQSAWSISHWVPGKTQHFSSSRIFSICFCIFHLFSRLSMGFQRFPDFDLGVSLLPRGFSREGSADAQHGFPWQRDRDLPGRRSTRPGARPMPPQPTPPAWEPTPGA